MALTETAIRKAKPKAKSYKMSDTLGLYLQVNPSGSKLWRLKYHIDGVERKLALGSYPMVKLTEAREARDVARKQVSKLIDPNAAKRQERIVASISASNTFATVAEELLAKREIEGLSPRTMEKYVWLINLLSPDFVRRPVSEITPAELLHELRHHERRGRFETAKRLRSMASRVFRYAAATARTDRDPAHMLLGALIKPKPKHFAAITDPEEFGGLLRAIEDYQGDPATLAALKLTPHLFQRPGEMRQMEWRELNFDKAVWTLPIEKMKMRQPHAVPLSRQSLAILESLKPITGGGKYVFASAWSRARPISENTVSGALRRMGYTREQMTAHGFRTTASSLLNECGKWSPDAIERALAHMVSGEVRRIYNRSAYWTERVEMAQWWSDYIDELREGRYEWPMISERAA
jgi:integrase